MYILPSEDNHGWKPSTIPVRLDFLKYVQISFPPKRKSVQKTFLDFLVSNANLYSKSRHTVKICVYEERKIWTHLGKSRRTKIVWGFRLRLRRVSIISAKSRQSAHNFAKLIYLSYAYKLYSYNFV